MGAGKTTLVQYLHGQYGVRPVYEPFMDNPYLDDFYRDMKGWAFHSQVYFLTHKYRLHLELERDLDGATVVMDRSIYEDAEIFATNLRRSGDMHERDFATYMELYDTMRASLQPPDLMIYLRCDLRSIRRRIRRRGRPSEQEIPVAYIRRLNDLYENWISGWDRSPVLVWDSGRQDYLTHLVDRIDFQRAVEDVLGQPLGADVRTP